MNSFGKIYRLTTFGESHGEALGGVIDGMPAGLRVDMDALQHQLDRRRPGQSDLTTSRSEPDRVELLSGIFDGTTTGTSIGFIIRNTSARSSDYSEMEALYRPSHADYTYTAKYGIRDHRGGGRSSARGTAVRIVAGALAAQALAASGVRVWAYTSAVGDITMPGTWEDVDPEEVDSNAVRCPDAATAGKMASLIREVKADGDTVGGVITGVIEGCPPGLGEPVGYKLGAALAQAMMSINAAKGFELGMGFEGCRRRGSEMMDRFATGDDGRVVTTTNNSGGIQGGLSNGMPIVFRVAFKPVATLLRPVETIDKDGRPAVLKARGRHDPCVLPRAVPIVEAMAAMTVFDAMLLNRCARL